MRKRTFVLVVVSVLVLAGAVSGSFALRSSGGVTGLCASPPAGFRERYVRKSGMQEATVVLTNFRFGRMDDLYGLSDSMRWPRDGITVAVTNEGPDANGLFKRALRVNGADFKGFEGMRWPAAHLSNRSHGRVLEAFAEVRTVTPASIATVNHALAGVHVCTA